MKKVTREDVLDNSTYERMRDALRSRAMLEKKVRRIHLGEHLTFLFETTETMRIQVQEMLRIEGRSSEADIRHELDTYNALLGGPGELGCTLLVEFEEDRERDQKLRAWLPLVDHTFAVLPDGRRVSATFDRAQVGDERLSSVQYMKFAVGGVAPTAFAVDMADPPLRLEVVLTPEQRAALEADLASG